MTSPAYPVALDALANPGPTTETDDAGFELDIVIARLQNIAMAIEAKVGIGASTPSTAGVLRRTATGASAWGLAQTLDVALGTISQWQQQIWGTGQVSTSTTAVGIPNSFVTMTTNGGPVIVLLTATVTHTLASQYVALQGVVDGTGLGEATFITTAIVNGYAPFAVAMCAQPSANVSHTFGALWRVSAGQAGVQAGLTTVIEIKR